MSIFNFASDLLIVFVVDILRAYLVNMTIDEGANQTLPLHQAVFLKDGKRLQQLIESEKYDIDEKDKFGKCYKNFFEKV